MRQAVDYNLLMTELEGSLYELIGGETGLRSLVDRFYVLMDISPEAASIRAFHAKGLKQSREMLWCMNRAPDESQIDPRVKEYLKVHFAETADFLRNVES